MTDTLTIKEIEDLAKQKGRDVSGEYIRRQITEGRLPGEKRGGAWFVPRGAALAWIDKYVKELL